MKGLGFWVSIVLLVNGLVWGVPTSHSLAQEMPNLEDLSPEELDRLLQETTEKLNRTSEALNLLMKGQELHQEGTVESLRLAIVQFEAALERFQAIPEPIGIATSLTGLGRVYSDLDEWERSLTYYNHALSVLEESGIRPQQATVLNNLGNVYSQLGKPQEAIQYFQQSLAILQEAGDSAEAAQTLNNIGAVYGDLGNYEEALNYYNQALSLLKAGNDSAKVVIVLNNIGVIHDSRGDLKEALASFEEVLSLLEVGGSKDNLALVFNNMGSVYSDLGDFQTALNHFQKALPLMQEVGNRTGESDTLNNISLVYSDLGDYPRAIDYLNQSLRLSQTVGNVRGEAITVNNLGLVYSKLQDHSQALQYYRQALPLLQQVENSRGQAYALTNMGQLYFELNQPSQAQATLTQALQQMQQVGDKVGEAQALNNLGQVLFRLGNAEQALTYHRQALPLRRAVGDRRGEAASLYELARVERDRGNLSLAVTHLESALDIVETLRTKVNSQELRTSYFATVQDYYQLYVDLLMQLHQQSPEEGLNAKALYASERSRARSLLEFLSETGTDIRQGVNPQLLEQEQTLQNRISATAKRQTELLSASHTPEQANAIATELQNLLRESQQLQEQIRAASPSYAALKYPQPLTVTEIQQKVLDENTLLLQYALGEERSYLWAVTSQGIKSYELPSQQVIEQAVRNFRNTLTAPTQRNSRNRVAQGANTLSAMLLQPALAEFASNAPQRLLIAGDGILHYLPFTALSLPHAEEYTPLITQYEVVNVPSASSLAVIREQTASRQTAPKEIALIADPVFSVNDERLSKSGTPIASANSVSDRVMERAVTGMGITGNLQRLPGTRAEAQQIAALLPSGEKVQAFDFQANRQMVTGQDLSQYRFVHFATHGFVNSTNPELSGLVLSLVNENGLPEDGFLRLHDIFNLQLNADLVVLSACETGLGESIRGEGLIGLNRGFMYAGAQRVVTSLWSVSDEHTAQLMSQFYTQMLLEGRSPAAALRAAQLQMWQQNGWSSPYYWAAFTLQGEWK